MKRAFLLAAAGLLANGCYTTNNTPSYTSGSCPQSGVDYIEVKFTGGGFVDPTYPQIPCVFQGVQGASFAGFAAGTYSFDLTGFRVVNSTGVPLFKQTQVVTSPGGSIVLYWQFGRFDVTQALVATYDPMAPCGFAGCATVRLDGIPDDLAINDFFVSANGSATLGTYCAAPLVAVDTITYNLVDGFGTSVASGQMSCGTVSVQAGIDFLVASNQGIDRDVYSIRTKGRTGGTNGTVVFDTATRATAPTVQFPNCAQQTFNHYGSDTGTFAWDVLLYDVSGNATFCP